MGIGTGGIPTTDNIPEATEIFGCPTDNIPDNRFFRTRNFIIFALKIKLNTCKNNRNFISIYFKAKCQSKCEIYMQDYMQILNYL